MRAMTCLVISNLLLPPAFASGDATTALEERLADALELMRSQQHALATQQHELISQRKLLLAQGESIARLQSALDDLRGSTESDTTPAEDRSTPPPLVTRSDRPQPSESGKVAPPTGQEVAADAKQAQQDDPTRAIQDSLPGAIRLPGTSAVMRWGGYAKSTIVQNFDPLAITDRFIVGAIPSGNVQGIETETEINVSQSRLNFDLREPTDVGTLRAFIEGDFDGDRDTFRLRHAFGQRGALLMGKTWSAFVDTTASPEEIDFEGLNGRINVRQGQLRWQPGIGRKYELVISLEDPNPQVTNGEGVSQYPDIVGSARLNVGEKIHGRIALLLRQVRAQWDENPGDTKSKLGWGVSLSGHVEVPWLDERDKILVQLNAGTGYGRYVNDLSSVGDFDGVFSANGQLELIDVYSGYISAQHWWRSNIRSNFTLGIVDLDNPNFVDDSFYRRTYRASSNLIWSPTPRMDIGAELLWGRRENEDGSKGDATQLQLATKFRF
ncbi:MAG: DcaP family trimeric outer membrane transporter [Pseudomonadales bacterium]